MSYSNDDATGWGVTPGAQPVPALPTAHSTPEAPVSMPVGCWVWAWPTAGSMQTSVNTMSENLPI